MRSASEIAFRLRQEIANAVLLGLPSSPRPAAAPSPLPLLPDPRPVAAHLADSAFRHDLRAVVEQVLSGCIPALGLTLATGSDIHWRRDYVSGRETPLHYFRRIPYLDAAQAGDHKVIWEINRHQHLAALAQETLFEDAHPAAAAELFRQIESWLDANPFQRGINWSSALEVAFRSLSWIWIHHFAGNRFPPALQTRFLGTLYQHGLHLEFNLSVYFSPNTHLLGEAVALYALGVCFPQWPRSELWRDTGSRIVEQEMGRQVRDDGSHFEQSAYYHVYATDMFLFYAVLARPGEAFVNRLARMAEFLDALLGPSRLLPMLGDDDGGRFFYPYGDRTRWPVETLAACATYLSQPPADSSEALHPLAAWWFGQPALAQTVSPRTERSSRWFPQSGIAIMLDNEVQVIADSGPFGPGSAGHSHSDTLSIVVRRGGRQILIDPATYTYLGDPIWRERFRSSAAHNTIRIDGNEQASPSGPFGWRRPHPEVAVKQWVSLPTTDILEASCRYSGFLHVRRILFVKPALVVIADRIEGPSGGQHLVEWFWHPGETAALIAPSLLRMGEPGNYLSWDATLSTTLSEGGDYGWRSPAFGVKQPAPVLRLKYYGPLPVSRVTILDCSGLEWPGNPIWEENGTLSYGKIRVDLDTGVVTRT